MRILVLGASGLLGRALRRRAREARMVCVAPPRDHAELDRTLSLRAAFGHAEPDVVINAAAFTDVDGAETAIDRAFAVNRDGAARVAALCAQRDLPLLHLSTDYVFDGALGGPLCEDHATAPLGVYGASKLAGERAVRRIHEGATVLRTAWLHDDAVGFPHTMLALAERHGHLRVVADQYGSPTHVDDLADALLTLARRSVGPAGAPGGLFHLAGSTGTSRHEWVRALLAASEAYTGRPVTVEPVPAEVFPTPARRPVDARLDCSRIERVHGIRLPDWRERLPATVRRSLDRIAATA